MPRIDDMYKCCNFNWDENLNKTCNKNNEFKRCVLLDDNYYCYNYESREKEKGKIMNDLDQIIHNLEVCLNDELYSDKDYTLLAITKLIWANQKELFQRVESLENRMTAVENMQKI